MAQLNKIDTLGIKQKNKQSLSMNCDSKYLFNHHNKRPYQTITELKCQNCMVPVDCYHKLLIRLFD